MNIREKVDNFKTESEWGFTVAEIEKLREDFPPLNEEKFNSALAGITCMRNDKGETVIYPCDVELAIRCGLENRDLKSWEWD